MDMLLGLDMLKRHLVAGYIIPLPLFSQAMRFHKTPPEYI